MRPTDPIKWLLGAAVLWCALALPGQARAQVPDATSSALAGLPVNVDLPVQVSVAGNVAVARIGPSSLPLAEVTLTFDDASNLGAGNLGIAARLVSASDATLLARLPGNLIQLDSALPLLVTIQPPVSGGLSFRRTGRYELHTHLLPYAVGSNLRVFKAPLGGSFRDTTEEIASGSVRARSRYGGFSQFLVAVDLRPTSLVVADKIGWLRKRVATLPATEQPAFAAQLDAVAAAVADRDYGAAIAAADAIAARAQARAGTALTDTWRAGGADNQAGDLIAGATTLKFSLGYLQSFGE
ncbi:MAG TPA: DUF6689 family protein [Xanthomonadaceae bacterium]|nr:DUF6689 family protein [Xanthomonadaceae bacterium]